MKEFIPRCRRPGSPDGRFAGGRGEGRQVFVSRCTDIVDQNRLALSGSARNSRPKLIFRSFGGVWPTSRLSGTVESSPVRLLSAHRALSNKCWVANERSHSSLPQAGVPDTRFVWRGGGPRAAKRSA